MKMRKIRPIKECVEFPLIRSHPAIQAGEKTITGTRIQAWVIGNYVKVGEPVTRIAREFDLSIEQVQQARDFCAVPDKRKLHWKKIGECDSYW